MLGSTVYNCTLYASDSIDHANHVTLLKKRAKKGSRLYYQTVSRLVYS